jgi:hypothetical protein
VIQKSRDDFEWVSVGLNPVGKGQEFRWPPVPSVAPAFSVIPFFFFMRSFHEQKKEPTGSYTRQLLGLLRAS